MSELPSHLHERYGVSNSPRQNRLKRIGIAALAAAFIAIVLWVSWVFVSGNQIKVDTVGYEHLSDSTIEITFAITMDPGTSARCSLQALNENRGQAGVAEYVVEPQTERTSFHQVQITTQHKAVGATVGDCVKVQN